MSDFNCNISSLKENNEKTSSKPVRKNKRFLCSSTPKDISNKKLRITRYSPFKNSPEAISMTISIPRPDFLPLNVTFTTEKVKNKITLEMIRDNVLIPVEVSDFIEDGKKLDKHDQANDVCVLNFFSVVVRESEKIPIELIKCPDNLQLQINVLPETSVEDSEPIAVLEKSLSEYNFSCPKQGCRETFFRLSRLITHMENCIDKISLASIKITPIKCPECQQKFILKDLLSHFSKKHLLLNWYFGQIDQGNWAICQNYKCAKYMDQVDDIVEHFRSCDYLWQCKHCSVEFKSESKVRKHRCCTTSEDDSDEMQKKSNKTEHDPCKNKYLAAKIKALKAKLNKKGSKNLNRSCVSDVSVNKEHSECTNGHTKELMFTEIVDTNTTHISEINDVGQNKGALDIVKEIDNGQKYKHFKKKKEKSKISASPCKTQEQIAQPETYTLDLDNWSKHFLEFNFTCPIIGCNDSFFLPWQLFKHLRKKCSKTPSVKDANKIISQLESMKFPCLISSCKKYNEMFVLQEYCYHYKSTHLILFKLLYHASRGIGQCFNYKCSAKITTSKEALIHSEECKFLWQCEKCQFECQHFASKRSHVCTKEIISEEPLVSLDGKRKKRKSAAIAINKLNELVAEISDIKEEKNNLEDRGAREDDDFVASSAASVSSNDEDSFNNELEGCNENVKNRVMKRTSTLIFKDIQFYKIWLKENISTGVLFPEWLPTVECLKVISSSEYSLHIPSFSCIRNIEVEYFTGINSSRKKESHSAELFKPFPELKGSETLGFNVGGPVWGLSWCPTIDGEDQILAVSTHKTFAEHYGIVNMVAVPGCIQIWNLGKLKKKKDSSLPRLSICICHSYGPIYSFEWCPSGCYTRDAGVKRIGLLAIACGDGKVRILSIPDPSNLSYNEPIFANLDPVITLLPQKLDAIEQINTGMALCVTWMPSCGHSKIAAGYGDGGLRIWDLNTSSIFLKVNDQGKPALLPIQYIDAHSYSLRSVAWCPYNKNIIATGSGDKCLKVFDVNNPHLPVYCSKRESVFHIEWPKNRIGLFVSSDTCFNVLPGSARYLVLDYLFNPQKAEADSIHLTTRHNAAVLCCSYNNHLDLIATCDVAGEVIVSKDQDKPSTKIINSNVKIEPVYHIVAECSDELSIDQTNDDDEASEVTDEYIESLNVADQYKKLGPKIEKEFQISRFKFIDSNKFEFSKTRLRNDPDVLRTARNETMSTAVLEKTETRAVHRVTWNQNDGYHTWLASGTRLGVVRLHNFKAWT